MSEFRRMAAGVTVLLYAFALGFIVLLGGLDHPLGLVGRLIFGLPPLIAVTYALGPWGGGGD